MVMRLQADEKREILSLRPDSPVKDGLLPTPALPYGVGSKPSPKTRSGPNQLQPCCSRQGNWSMICGQSVGTPVHCCDQAHPDWAAHVSDVEKKPQDAGTPSQKEPAAFQLQPL